MKGRILGFDGNECAINTDAGERFKFALSEWKGGERPPQPRDEVDFIGADGVATEVYLLSPAAGIAAAPIGTTSGAAPAAYGQSASPQTWPAGRASSAVGKQPKAKLWRGGLHGRLSRKDFWGFWLILVLCQLGIVAAVAAASYAVAASTSGGNGASGAVRDIGLLARPFQLILTGMWVSITIRRLHDSGHSGWWVLLGVAWIGLSIAAALMPDLASGGWAILFSIAFLAGGFVELWPLYWIFIRRGDEGPNRFGPDPLAPLQTV